MKHTFHGFRRNNGTAGTRNHIGLLSSVICSSIVTNEIADQVPGGISIVHSNGCGQLGDDFHVTKNMLIGAAANPNLYASLFVGLGCETNQVSGLLKSMPKSKPFKGIGIQQMAGGKNTVETGVSIAGAWSEDAMKEKREPLPLSLLKVGVITVDTDEVSLKKMTPVVNRVIGKLLKNDVTVVVGLTKTLEPSGDVLAENLEDSASKQKLTTISEGLHRKRWKENQTYEVQGFTEEERTLASLEAGIIGNHPVVRLLDYNDEPEEAGLHVIKSSGNIVESLSNFTSIGCNIALIISSRGILTGAVAIPCMTVTPSGADNAFSELVDSKIDDEEAEQQAARIFENLLAIASGKETVLEAYELGEFSIPHVGTTF
jgi:altronate dehydratase